MRPIPLAAAGLALATLIWRWGTLSRGTRAATLAAVLGLAIYGGGAFDLPNVESTLLHVGQALGPYTYLLVGLLAFLETGAGVGLVAPGEVAVVVGGVTAGQGETNIVVLIGVVWACALMGDTVSFMLGRHLGRDWVATHGPRLKLTPKRMEQIEGFFGRHGAKTIILGRFVGVVRALAPFVAGASRMSPRRYIPAAALAAGIWSATFSLLGYAFWQSFEEALALAKQGSLLLVALIAVGVGGMLLYRWMRQRR